MAKITKAAFFFFFFFLCLRRNSNGEETTTIVTSYTVDSVPSLNFNGSELTNKTMNNSTSTSTSHPDLDPEMTLKDFENGMKKLLGSVFSQAFSYASQAGIPPKASSDCLFGLVKMYFGIRNLEPWAFQMMDSSGKLSGGLLEGTSSALGDYDECLDVIIGGKPHPRASIGEYCLLEIKPPGPIIRALKEYQINRGKDNTSLSTSKSFLGFLRKIRTNPDHVMFRIGICMPSSCEVEDVQDIVDMVAARLDVDVNVVRCEYKGDWDYEIQDILIMVFLSNIIALTVVGTIFQFCCQRGYVGDNASLEPGPNALKLQNRWRRLKLFEILSKFSISHSTERLMNCKEDGDALDVIRGVKVLTVIFAIYTHTYALPHPLHLYRFRDTLNFSKFLDEVLFGTVANSSVGVDTFFFLAGFLFIYYRWRLLKKPLIFKYIGKFILVNYIRMVAAQILVIFLFALFPLIGSGPLWHEFVEEPLENCAKTWWMNILLIQNFLGPYDSCLYHSWILATMMQLFIVTAIVVWIMHRKPVIGVSINILLIVTAAIAVSIVTIVADFPATFTIYFYDFRTSIKYWKYLYVQAYNHIGPFCVGMLVAYYIAEHAPPKTRKPFVLCLWIASLLTCCAIVFGLYHYREEQDMNRVLAVFYSALHRPAWALAIGWIVYACATDNGGFANSVLSWKALIPMERLCYLAFLLHVPVMYFHGGVQRERMFMGHYNQFMCFLSYTVFSFLLSCVCYLLFQAPYHTIEHYIFGIQKDNIWQADSAAVSTETLETEDSERKEDRSDNARVLYNRYEQTGDL